MLSIHALGDWETLDLLKIICAIIAGLILGAEREFKDKSAGLKTIATICIGSTLFTMLSYKIGAFENSNMTQIAAYVVSGIGFLGAGVIFKDGFNIGGLTTASIIWVSAAIGMAIGFGEFYLAALVLVSTIIILVLGNLLNKHFFSLRSSYNICISIPIEAFADLKQIELKIAHIARHMEQRKIEKTTTHFAIHFDIFIAKAEKPKIINILNEHIHIDQYTIQ